MKQTARIISTYSADVMGVCSALFELGGMTIMHDASGCNSTYTTHDEPRWYDMDSMVYISGISEIEAIMGDDEKLISDIEDAAASLNPAFIAIAGTPIPTMVGFDFEAVAEVIEMRTGIPTFGFPTTGMNTYINGASMALAGIAERFAGRTESAAGSDSGADSRADSRSDSRADSRRIRVNILGLTPLDFSINGTDSSVAVWLEEKGFEVWSKWAMGSTLDELCRSGDADVNLVVSAAGLGAAKVLYDRFSIPYVIGMPVGNDLKDMINDALREAAGESMMDEETADDSYESPDAGNAGDSDTESITVASDLADYAEEQLAAGITPEELPHTDIVLIGEGITSLALASAIEFETGRMTKVLCATECPDGILRNCDRMTPDEDDIIPELEGAEVIIADPLYKPICPESARFLSLPSEAFSGRIYREDIPDLVKDFETFLDQII